MKISTAKTELSAQKADALIVFCQGTRILLRPEESELIDLIETCLKNSSFKGEAAQIALFPLMGKLAAKQLILTGLGEPKHFYNGLLEQAAAAAIRAGKAAGLKRFALTNSMSGLSDQAYLTLTCRGAGWGSYSFETFKSGKTKPYTPSLCFVGEKTDKAIANGAEQQAEALIQTANLANLPGNAATPRTIAQWAQQMADENRLDIEIFDEKQLKKKGCGGILAVGQGSKEPPRMIIIKYKGTMPETPPIVLVGKTVTFDSGGISLKPGKGMGWMRYDKCGGMAVLAAIQMIARLKLPHPVTAILGAAENMPGANATRPGDIITAYSGKTIEILNTDAEGRLILADALAMGAALKPKAMVDLATLTGAVIVALGKGGSAILGNDENLIAELIQSGINAGERLWQLPLWKEFSDDMKSDFADLSNLAKSGTAGTATAAAFLQEFVPETIPWAHLDIAGTAWLESTQPHQAAGATLFGARLLTQWVQEQGER
jgi:leucyl aminopeptidase